MHPNECTLCTDRTLFPLWNCGLRVRYDGARCVRVICQLFVVRSSQCAENHAHLYHYHAHTNNTHHVVFVDVSIGRNASVDDTATSTTTVRRPSSAVVDSADVDSNRCPTNANHRKRYVKRIVNHEPLSRWVWFSVRSIFHSNATQK